jgi:hypothetical protein
MKVAVLSAAVLVSLTSYASGPTWNTVTSKSDGYVATFPGTPRAASKDISRGKVKATMYGHTIEVAEGGLLVLYVDCPFSVAQIAGKERKILADSAAQVKQKPGLTVVKEQSTSFDKYPAHVLLLKMESGGMVIDHIVLKGKRVYQIMWVGPEDHINSETVKKFFAGFKLL